MFLCHLNRILVVLFPVLISPVLLYQCKEEFGMAAIWKSIHNFEDKFDRNAECFAFHHPYLAFLAMFIGMPLFILIAVAVSTTLIAIPIAWIFGWL